MRNQCSRKVTCGPRNFILDRQWTFHTFRKFVSIERVPFRSQIFFFYSTVGNFQVFIEAQNIWQNEGSRKKLHGYIYIEVDWTLSPLYKEALYITAGVFVWKKRSLVQIFKLSSIPFVRLPVTCWQHSAYVTRTPGFIVIRLRLMLKEFAVFLMGKI